MRRIVFAVVFLSWTLLVAGVVTAREGSAADPTPDTGAWIATRVDTKGDTATARSWERQLRTIESLIKAAPVFKDLHGYYPGVLLKAAPPVGGKGPWLGYVVLEIWWPFAVDIGPGGEPTVKPKFEYNRPESTWITINGRGSLDHWVWWEDHAGRFYEIPETRREIAGFPVVGDRLFIKRADKPPLFDPLPLERALRWVVAALKRQVKVDEDTLASSKRAYEEFMSPAGQERRRKEIEAAAASQKKPENQAIARRHAEAIDRRREQDRRDATLPPKPGSPRSLTAELLASNERRLAALSPAERTQPAWIRRKPDVRGAPGAIVPENTPGARPLAVESPFFDPALPADAMQLVTVPYFLEDRMKHPESSKRPQNYVPFRVIEQADWRAVQELLR
jgi:hypothetical protein